MLPAPPSRASLWKWSVTGLLLLATTINYMDRVTLANASVRVTREMALNDQQYGNIEIAFGWAFALGSLVFGFLADRLRVYWLYPAVLAGWSLMGMAAGWTESYAALLACRAGLGFFEAAHWPCALKVSFALLAERERTMGNSIIQSGASIGAILTPLIMAMMLTSQAGSWRTAFVAVGSLGGLWVLLWFVVMKPDDLPHAPGSGREPGLGRYLTTGRFWAVALLLLGAQTVWHIYRVWLMKFLQTGRGYDEAFALKFTSVFYIATDVGCICGGLLSLWLVRRWACSAHRARRWVHFAACCLTSLSVCLPWLGQGWPLLGVLLLIGAGALALFPCFYSFSQEISATHVGRISGLLSLWVWAVSSPMHGFFGMIADQLKSYDGGLVLAGLAPWMGVISMKLLWRDEEAA